MTQREKPALVGNAGDEQQVRRGKETERARQERELNDLRAVLRMPEGRRFIWRLLDEANVFASAFSENPAVMAFLEGRRDFGTRLIALVNDANDNALIELMLEAQKAKRNQAPPPSGETSEDNDAG